jgi:hypothetical protein
MVTFLIGIFVIVIAGAASAFAYLHLADDGGQTGPHSAIFKGTYRARSRTLRCSSMGELTLSASQDSCRDKLGFLIQIQTSPHSRPLARLIGALVHSKNRLGLRGATVTRSQLLSDREQDLAVALRCLAEAFSQFMKICRVLDGPSPGNIV